MKFNYDYNIFISICVCLCPWQSKLFLKECEKKVFQNHIYIYIYMKRSKKETLHR